MVNNLTCSIKSNPMPDGTSEESSAERFAYFKGKIERIRDELKDAPTFQPSQNPYLKSKLNKFKSNTEEEVHVCKIIQYMATQSCESDALQMNIVKQELHQLLPIITRIVNLSLTQEIFSDNWKTAIVRPLIKLYLELIHNNYRPIPVIH